MSKVMQISRAAGVTAAKTSFKASDKNMQGGKNAEKSGIDKSFVYSAAAAIGLAAIAGWMLLRGKGNKAEEALHHAAGSASGAAEQTENILKKSSDTIRSGVRKFLINGREVQNASVILKNGQAVYTGSPLFEGHPFDGIMETINNRGDKISIGFDADGYWRFSKINGKAAKTHLRFCDADYITIFNDKSETVKTYTRYFGSGGETKRLFITEGSSWKNGVSTAVDFAPDGSILSKVKINASNMKDGRRLIEIHDADGKLVKKYKTELFPYEEAEEIIPINDGRSIGIKGRIFGLDELPKASNAEMPAAKPDSAVLYDKNGVQKLSISGHRDGLPDTVISAGDTAVRIVKSDAEFTVQTLLDNRTFLELPDIKFTDSGIKFINRKEELQQITKSQLERLLPILEDAAETAGAAGFSFLPAEKIAALKDYMQQLG